MPNSQFNGIKVLLSCPEDVIRERDFLDLIEKVVSCYNYFFSKTTRTKRLKLTHWKENIYLGKGRPRVQDRINYRLVDICDIFTGILWTRFESSPGITTNGLNFESGSEEEFDRARKIVKDFNYIKALLEGHVERLCSITREEKINKKVRVLYQIL